MKRLDQHLKDYYQGKTLPPEKVSALLAEVQAVPRKRRHFPRAIPMAAAAMLVIGIGLWLTFGAGGSLINQIVGEIAQNHVQQGSLMVESDQYDVVQAALSQLDFSIQPPRDGLLQSFVLLGGKYCSIQGYQAAQLKLRHNASGIIHTLYVSPLAAPLEGVELGVYNSARVHVELWTDHHLLYGLARSK